MLGSMPETLITIPCCTEAERLRPEEVLRLLVRPDVSLMMVNDGSALGTAAVLEQLRSRSPSRIHVLSLAQNSGKGEAVRQGLRASLERGAAIVGYIDADMSTPPEEMLRLIDTIDRLDVSVVLASRVALLGAHIDRSPRRHYLGRLFAAAASLVLEQVVYDTQCGAKLFRATPMLDEALEEPFHSHWAFDVEFLGRLMAANRHRGLAPTEGMLEEPLARWTEVGGSKLGIRDMVRAGLDLLAIRGSLRRGR
jgi:dolichyl-phosphate beta-glucosyltransferase